MELKVQYCLDTVYLEGLNMWLFKKKKKKNKELDKDKYHKSDDDHNYDKDYTDEEFFEMMEDD